MCLSHYLQSRWTTWECFSGRFSPGYISACDHCNLLWFQLIWHYVNTRVFRKIFLCQNQSHRVAIPDKYCLKEHVKILTLYPNGKWPLNGHQMLLMLWDYWSINTVSDELNFCFLYLFEWFFTYLLTNKVIVQCIRCHWCFVPDCLEGKGGLQDGQTRDNYAELLRVSLFPWARETLSLEESISLHLVHNTVQAVGVNVDKLTFVYNFTLWGQQERLSLHRPRCSKMLFFRSTSYAHFDGNLMPDCSAANADRACCCFGGKCGEIVGYSRSGGRSGRRVCLSRLSCPINNSKLTWYLTSQCHHSCSYAESRQPDLEVKNHHFNQAEVV